MTAPRLRLDSVVVRTGPSGACERGEEIFMVSERRGRYYGLGAVGTHVWKLLGEPIAVADLCTALEAEFEVTRPVLERDVLAFVQRLAQEGLLEVVAAGDLTAR